MMPVKRLVLRIVWLLFPVVLIYVSYVNMAGYPNNWDHVWPCMTVQEVIDICGEPDEVSNEYGMIWRSAHLLGWHELNVDRTADGMAYAVYIKVSTFGGAIHAATDRVL